MLYLVYLRDGSAFSSLDEKINSNLLDVMSRTSLVLCPFLAIYFCKYKYECLLVQAYGVLHPFCIHRKV